MKKRPFTLTMMNSENDQLSDEMKNLILAYMEAYTNDNYALAETYLHQIRQIRELNDGSAN